MAKRKKKKKKTSKGTPRTESVALGAVENGRILLAQESEELIDKLNRCGRCKEQVSETS